MNVSATLNAFKLIAKPSLCIPHATVPTFDRVPLPLSRALEEANGGERPDIRAVVLDKDNCFAKPKANVIYKPYNDKFKLLRNLYDGPSLLIVSNSAGTDDDRNGKEAEVLEKATGIKVLRHSTKKPGCGPEVFEYLQRVSKKTKCPVEHPSQIAMIGDRLFTDVMMANMMGSWSIWVKDGVVKNDGTFSRLEKGLPNRLTRLGLGAPIPKVD